MAFKLLNYTDKQALLYGDRRDSADLGRVAQLYEEAGILCDAAGFFNVSENQEKLRQLAANAFDTGDTFLYVQCRTHLGESASADELNALGERAESLGKIYFARSAFEAAGNEAAVERCQKLIEPEDEAVDNDQHPEQPNK